MASDARLKTLSAQPAATSPAGHARTAIAPVTQCTRCNDTGENWVVCPDAGAVRVPCECRAELHAVRPLVDLGFAGAIAACAGMLYLVL